MCFFLIGFLFASGKWFRVFFLCFFCPSCVPQFLAASSPKSDVFFHEDLAYLACSTNDERTISAGSTRRVACATNCNNKCCSNGPATIWNRWWNNKWLVLQVWFVVPSGFRLASACLGTASGNEPGNFPSPCQSSKMPVAPSNNAAHIIPMVTTTT